MEQFCGLECSGAEDAAGEGEAESQAGVEKGGGIFLALWPVDGILRIIWTIPGLEDLFLLFSVIVLHSVLSPRLCLLDITRVVAACFVFNISVRMC